MSELITLKNGAQGHYVERTYKKNALNDKLGRTGKKYKKFIIVKAGKIPKRTKTGGKVTFDDVLKARDNVMKLLH